MILTLTPNPSVDRTVFVDALPRGAVIRSSRGWSEPSGKGVNVALALQRHDRPATAVLPVGGSVGAQLSQMLRLIGLPVREVPVRGEIRSNISLVEPDGTVTKVNEPGPELDT
ncbi:1-phosphofructokinase, partial [Micromonospora sp. STR1_7]